MIWDPSDANPMHRRLPAEITSRRAEKIIKKGPTQPKTKTEDVEVDLNKAVSVKPDARPKWLSKACRMTQEGKAPSTELYNIVVSRRFSAGIPERIGRKIGVIVQKHLDLFSDKQRRHLTSSDFHLNELMKEAVEKDEAAGDIEDEEAPAERDPEDNDYSQRSEAMKELMRDSEEQENEKKKADEKRREADAVEAREADRMTRIVEEAARRNRREADKKEESKKNFMVEESEKMSRLAEAKEADKRRKLEEEADALLERAMNPSAGARNSRDERRDRDRGRSRSISAKANTPSPPRDRGRWRRERPTELTGSRGMFLNPDYQEDLPHLQRPDKPGGQARSWKPPSQGGGGSSQAAFRAKMSEQFALKDAGRSPSRSRRDRSRDRRRRR